MTELEMELIAIEFYKEKHRAITRRASWLAVTASLAALVAFCVLGSFAILPEILFCPANRPESIFNELISESFYSCQSNVGIPLVIARLSTALALFLLLTGAPDSILRFRLISNTILIFVTSLLLYFIAAIFSISLHRALLPYSQNEAFQSTVMNVFTSITDPLPSISTLGAMLFVACIFYKQRRLEYYDSNELFWCLLSLLFLGVILGLRH